MRKLFAVLLVLVMLLTQFALPSFAYDDYGVNEILDYEEEWEDPYAGLKVKSIKVEATRNLIQKADGYYDLSFDGEEIFVYDVYYAEPFFTVVFENGEEEACSIYELYEGIYFDEGQYEKPWGVGKHQVTGTYRDAEFSFEVEVVESPVKSVKAVTKKALVEGWDGYLDMYFDENDEDAPPVAYTVYSIYNAEPVFTITMKDGTVITGNDEELYEQTGYYTYETYDQYAKPLKVGKNTVTFEYMGVEGTCELEIVPSPYKGVSLKGENELYLVFEGVDEKDTYETKIISAYIYDWNMEGDYYAYIMTDSGEEYDVVIYSDVDKDGMGTLDKNVSMAIGPCVTNTLETCNYFKIAYNSETILTAVMDYYQLSETISGKQFTGYNALEEANVNDVVALAAMITAGYEYVDYNEDNAVYKFSKDEIEDSIAGVFGSINVDVKKSDFYRTLLRRIEIKAPFIANCYYADAELSFVDGKWVDTADVYNWDTDEMVGKMTVVRNADGTIYSIDFEKVEIEKGDINCDGKITATDARFILQYVAGLVEGDAINMFYADANGDGEITAVDARIVLQKVAGLIE